MTKREAVAKLAAIRRDLLQVSVALPLPKGMEEADRSTGYAIGEYHIASAVADLDRAIGELTKGGKS